MIMGGAEASLAKLESGKIRESREAINNILNASRRGADVVYEKISDIHVSGHAFREELKLMKPGSVVVDMAAASGGNVAGSVAASGPGPSASPCGAC